MSDSDLALLKAENERLWQAVRLAKAQIKTLAEYATERLNEAGQSVDPAEKTYAPIIRWIDNVATGTR